MARRPNGKGDRLARLVAWIESKGRVTVADLCLHSGQDCKAAAKRLFAAEAAGALMREGGGPHDSFYWRKKP
jgi:hypothetical protein